jgi:hypothetical protein
MRQRPPVCPSHHSARIRSYPSLPMSLQCGAAIARRYKKVSTVSAALGCRKGIARASQRATPRWRPGLVSSAGDGRASWRGCAQPYTAGCAPRGVARGSHVSQDSVPRLTCLARWYTSPWPAFPRCGGTSRPGASAMTGRWAAGDAKRLALPRRLAYYRLNKERDQHASAVGADDRSSPATWGLRLVGTR